MEQPDQAHPPADTQVESHADPYAEVAAQLGMLFGRAHRWHQMLPPPPEGQQGLERAAYFLLAKVSKAGPLRPSALAEMVCLDLSTVSRHLSALERAGWVIRERDAADGRAQLVRVTPAGQAVVRTHRERLLSLVTEVLGDWSDDEVVTFVRLLRRFNDAADTVMGHRSRGNPDRMPQQTRGNG